MEKQINSKIYKDLLLTNKIKMLEILITQLDWYPWFEDVVMVCREKLFWIISGFIINDKHFWQYN